ncbi:peptidase M29 [Microbaculum marinisediminis]|uniref:Peptidase M29 n=1 Tax=Microbaculum marinisediminis TaxID=2931392 RepID=A0AAW5R496_9HYPH|nr:peptidase M29 [Microbaculum sp. A6E488]MCT8973949.1 peptidase M29 [Microbaculum sp. A6E488]
MEANLDLKWVKMFHESFQLSGVEPGQMVAIVSESQSNPVLVRLAELGLGLCGARVVTVTVPSAAVRTVQPIRSTGTAAAYDDYGMLLNAIAGCALIVDVTVEGLLHSPVRQEVLKAGGRIYMISNEHPEVLERCRPDPKLADRVDYSLKRLAEGKRMHVTSSAGTDLTVDIAGAPVRGGAGFLGPNVPIAYWPAGLALCFPLAGSVNGRVVLDVGDVNLTFKRYIETPVTLMIDNDIVVEISGDGLDAVTLRSYFAAWNDPVAYTIAHVGWGLNPGATWDSLMMYDKNEINGTELRAVEGNFLISTGANEFANRYTPCHFDFPMRACTVELDGQTVVREGRLQEPYL